MMGVFDFLIEPLSHDFMLRALLLAIVIGGVCALFSCFLILKGWSLMGDAVSHAVLPGVALAYWLGFPMIFGAFAAGVLCAAVTGYIKDRSRVKEDAVMGIIFSGMFGLGLVMIGKIESDAHLLHILFGNVLGVAQSDLWVIFIVAVLCGLYMALKRRDLMLYCFDAHHAAAIGMPVKRLHFTLLILLALTIVASLKAAGIILVIAMLIAPGATGFLLCKSFDKMLAVAFMTSFISCVSGTVASYYMDAATAPLIVVIQSGFFMLAFVFSRLEMVRGRGAYGQGA